MRAMMFAHDMLAAGSADVMVAGGMESMTNAPHLMFARKGVRYGAAQLFDHMAMDGLEDAYERGKAMGVFAEQCVAKYGFTREAQDALRHRLAPQRAKKANEDGSFDWEMAPVTLPGKGGDTRGQVRRAALQGQARQDPGAEARVQEGRHHHRRQRRSISDGAAALVLMRESHGRAARAEAGGAHRRATPCMRRRPTGSPPRRPAPSSKVLKKAGWDAEQVDLWEVNEAFAAVTMAAMSEFKLPHEIVNVHGGACALGHPIGASGARIVVTLLGALRKRGLKRGVAALCIGGGEATALARARCCDARLRWPAPAGSSCRCSWRRCWC